MQASLDDLNDHLDNPVSMNRFRPNIVLDGDQPAWAEDQWGHHNLHISVHGGNSIQLELCKPCSRCTVSVDQLMTCKYDAALCQFLGTDSSDLTLMLLFSICVRPRLLLPTSSAHIKGLPYICAGLEHRLAPILQEQFSTLSTTWDAAR